MAHDQLSLLDQFAIVEEFVLNPGDMLYIPPLVAHKGVAVSDAFVTYSVGFRSPSHAEVLTTFANECGMYISADLRLQDHGFTTPTKSSNWSHTSDNKFFMVCMSSNLITLVKF